jgi:prephenate dehydrogenase
MSSRVTIVGPGLLGGSLALALKARTSAHVAVWARRAESVDEISRTGCADVATTDLTAAVKGADVVVLATPVEAMSTLATQIAPTLNPGALVVDVGSVKTSVVETLAPIFATHGRFIGCHPMAGSEQSGFAAARADLFEGSVCILTPDATTPRDAMTDATSFWESVGCSVRTLAPAEHDEIVAWISHLPHLLAAALVQTIADRNPAAFDFSGPGFRDTTRVASGPPEMWTGILGQNRTAVREAVDGLIEKLRALSKLLADAADPERDSLIHQLLNQAKAQRDRLRLPKNSSDV